MYTRFKNFIYVGVTIAYSMIREERKKSKKKKAKRLSMRVPTRSNFFRRENKSLEEKHTEEVQGFIGL